MGTGVDFEPSRRVMDGAEGVDGPGAMLLISRGLMDVRIGAGVEVEGPRDEVILIRFGLCVSTSFEEPAEGPKDPGRGRAWKGGRGGDRSFQSFCM